MGSASSKAARRFPKDKPSWSGARTPGPYDGAPSSGAPRAGRPPRVMASETRSAAIEEDAKDPHLNANLSRLGPVRVDHHMQNRRTAADDQVSNMYRARTQSELDAASASASNFGTASQSQSQGQRRNRVLASTLAELLDARKDSSAGGADGVDARAERAGLSPETLRVLARRVNTPSADEATVKRVALENGEEEVTMEARWVEPARA
ncbi:hypothetical protein CONPUDRAFT_117914 [Coniophora puteana RWD-64-598 SS2]|uniref:Uncharacterized protein n=1 Tax=Coniophora puteana (strain RWD-64-598) TaxID=741705 RepID=A0A5M3N1F7_CONPW|nr:uncharacterized protein CONPUDRAFT_117914 [Coniophora puteana RWD-64-598 SS2]EIW85232.1 hypothetical protein CONPUDRAFT_117914 [Coniophora puteana RWD-64-598 SS2]